MQIFGCSSHLVFSDLSRTGIWDLQRILEYSHCCFFKYFFSSIYFFFSFWYSNYAYVPPIDIVPQFLDILRVFPLFLCFSLCTSIQEVSIDFSLISLILFSTMSSLLMCPPKDSFLLQSFFNLQCYLLNISQFLSLMLHY